jgi:hypothetical protein
MRGRRKVRALGLNYFVTCSGNPLQRHRREEARYTPEEFMSHNSYPSYKGLFLTRLWDPAGVNAQHLAGIHPHLSEQEARELAQQRKEEIAQMNQLRIGSIRACRAAFGERFFGGLCDSMYAREQAPDLILPPAATRKDAFLQSLRENYICIANSGLHRSTGWKLAEYTAAGRAIVTEPLAFEVPGSFRRGQNYAEFTTPEQCVHELAALLANPAQVHRMENANFDYYCRFVRPDALVLRTLRVGVPEFFGEAEAPTP